MMSVVYRSSPHAQGSHKCGCGRKSNPPTSLPNIGLQLDGCEIDLLSSSEEEVEKENDKLLVRGAGLGGGLGRSSQRYGDVERGYSSSTSNLPHTAGSSSNTLDTLRDESRKTSKDTYLKKISEEEPPQADCKRNILKGVVTVLFIVIVLGVVVVWCLHEGRSRKHVGNHYFDFIASKRILNVYNDDDDIVLTGYLKTSEFNIGRVRKCQDDQYENVFCFTFEDGTIFKFHPYKLGATDVNCINLMWENIKSYRQVATDCYDIEYGLWFGLPNFKGSFWPLDQQTVSIDLMSYRPYQDETLGHVIENYWLSTEGIAIIAHKNVPLRVSFNSGNDKRLCLELDTKAIKKQAYPNVNYTVCGGKSVKDVFVSTRNKFFPKTNVIDYKNHDFSKTIWTYNKYRNNLDDFDKFLKKLRLAGLDVGIVEFDSNWEKFPGDFKYDSDVLTLDGINRSLVAKFSSTKLMLPVSLACSYLSENNFMRGIKEQLFLKDLETGAFQTVLYHDQSCALWDASNPATRTFLKNAIDSLQQKGTEKQAAFPQAFEFQTLIGSSVYPLQLYYNTTDINYMTKVFLDVLLNLKKTVLMQTAFRLQDRAIFVEVPTTVVDRNGKKCLDYIVTGALTAGIHGYPYIVSLPPSPDDTVGHELFMRWMETAMFFPGLKVSNAAVNLEDVKDFAKNISLYRQSVVIPLIEKIIHEVDHGYPLLRPMWWINPMDFRTLEISDQFLIGQSVMVAPILCHGDRKRNIYIPEGRWTHMMTGKVYEGQQWLRDFEVSLRDIAVFQVLDPTASNVTVSV